METFRRLPLGSRIQVSPPFPSRLNVPKAMPPAIRRDAPRHAAHVIELQDRFHPRPVWVHRKNLDFARRPRLSLGSEEDKLSTEGRAVRWFRVVSDRSRDGETSCRSQENDRGRETHSQPFEEIKTLSSNSQFTWALWREATPLAGLRRRVELGPATRQTTNGRLGRSGCPATQCVTGNGRRHAGLPSGGRGPRRGQLTMNLRRFARSTPVRRMSRRGIFGTWRAAESRTFDIHQMADLQMPDV